MTATGSLVIRKLGETRAVELAIHRFLAAPSVTCGEMLETLAGRTMAAASGGRIVVAQDTTEINFAGREANRRGLGPAGDGVSAARRRSRRPDTGRQNRTPEKPPSSAFSCMAVLDHCETWGVKLLLQTTRTQDNESRVGTVRNDGRWVHDRGSSQSRVKRANPVA